MAHFKEAKPGSISKRGLEAERRLNKGDHKEEHKERLRRSREDLSPSLPEPVGDFTVGENGAIIFDL